MSMYLETLEVLLSSKSIKSKQDSLSKIAKDSKDVVLKELINSIVELYSSYVKPKKWERYIPKAFSKHYNWEKLHLYLSLNLERYIYQKIVHDIEKHRIQ